MYQIETIECAPHVVDRHIEDECERSAIVATDGQHPAVVALSLGFHHAEEPLQLVGRPDRQRAELADVDDDGRTVDLDRTVVPCCLIILAQCVAEPHNSIEIPLLGARMLLRNV